ncbi:MAG: 50S ribosomal protein L29 [Candidatus Dormiibacterota bacterium]
MKVEELRVLEVDELDGRLRSARRELYELRFKHAVGQLENSSEISKVRHDIARIMTVLTERQYGIQPSEDSVVHAPTRAERQGAPATAVAEAEPEEETPAPKPKRTRKAKTEEPK